MNDQKKKVSELLGLRIKDERSRLRMNRGVFAEHAGVSVGCVASIEHGEVDIENPTHMKVLRVLGLTIKAATLPHTKRRKWKWFKLYSCFSVRTRKLPPRNVCQSLHR